MKWITALLLLALVLLSGCRPSSSIIWQRRYDSGQEDFGRAVATDGREVIVGGTWRDTTDETVVVDWQLLRYDARGTLLWRRVYDSGELDWLSDIMVDQDHDIIATGSVASHNSDSVRLLLVKFTPEGEVVWHQTEAFGLATQGFALAPGRDGRIVVCGSNFTGADSATDDILVAQFDPQGKLVQWETLDFGADENGQDVTHDRNGNLVLVGSQLPLPESVNSVSTADLLVVKLDPQGKLLWRRIYDSGEHDLAGSLAVDSQDNVYAAVTFRDDDETSVRLVEYDAQGDLRLVTSYAGARNAGCTALGLDRTGSVLGVGAAGPDDAQRYLGFRYARNCFTDFLDPHGYHHGTNDLANDLALDADDNIIITGISDPGSDPDLLTIALRSPTPAAR
jgi:hypothetical protein